MGTRSVDLVVNETKARFYASAARTVKVGDACRRVLAGSRWTPPLDREGSPCATEVRYVCRFEVSR